MIRFGEAFFKVFSLNKEIQVNKPKEIERITKVDKPEIVNKDKDNNHQENAECIGCPLKHSDHCAKCLKVQQIYV